MISVLTRLFIKNADDTSKSSVRQAYGMLCRGTGIGLNVFLFLIKFLAGQKSNNDHPFGQGRIEYIAGMLVLVIILMMEGRTF